MAKAWYQYAWASDYGGDESFGTFPKPDLNIQCPDGTPITALLSGTISGLNAPDGSMPAWGASVTIRLDVPVNAVATHTAYLHLMPLPSGLRIGQKVSAGQLIGWSGGAKAAGSQKVPVGFALYNGDNYGYGASWNQYVGNPLLDPTGILKAAGGGKLNIPLLSNVSNLLSGETNSGITLVANADVKTLLYVLDQVLLLTNPFDMPAIKQDQIGPVSFTDPIAWVQQFGQNIMDDFSAATIRLLFLIAGIVILIKVSGRFIDYGAAGEAISNTAETVGKAAVLLA